MENFVNLTVVFSCDLNAKPGQKCIKFRKHIEIGDSSLYGRGRFIAFPVGTTIDDPLSFLEKSFPKVVGHFVEGPSFTSFINNVEKNFSSNFIPTDEILLLICNRMKMLGWDFCYSDFEIFKNNEDVDELDLRLV